MNDIEHTTKGRPFSELRLGPETAKVAVRGTDPGRQPSLDPSKPERFDVIVIGGGQAGLSMGHYLARTGLRFVILDASERIGDAWRRRWDSLRLFTPARHDGLDGFPFPAPPFSFPTKDEMADYLEAYATRFALPVRTGVRVEKLSRRGRGYVVEAGRLRFEADQVVIAMANFQRPRVPAFAQELAPHIVQLHSSEYRSPSQLRDAGVLIVGAANSGAEIAMELAGRRKIWLSGKHPGHVPFRTDGFLAKAFLMRFVQRFIFHRLLTVANVIGRKVRAKVLHKPTPLIRVKPADLTKAGVERVPRTIGIRDGLPVLEDGRLLDVGNVIWCTGYHPGFSWIDLPVFGEDGDPLHERGVVPNEPGLYFVGLFFLYSPSSVMIHGVGRDAARIADHVAARARATQDGDERYRPYLYGARHDADVAANNFSRYESTP